jgi:hypothetical protein
VEVMLFVSVFPRRGDVTNGGGEQLVTSLMVVRAYTLVTSLAPQAPRGCCTYYIGGRLKYTQRESVSMQRKNM